MYCEFKGDGWGAGDQCLHDHSNGTCPYYMTHTEHLCNLEGSPVMRNADVVRNMDNDELEKWFWQTLKVIGFYTDSHHFLHDWLNADVRDESLNLYYHMLKGDYNDQLSNKS